MERNSTGGARVFPDDGEVRPMKLVESKVATTGAILATYVARPADDWTGRLK
jgi:hypothetical protein